MKNILITGASGQVGLEIQQLSEQYPTYKFYFTNKDTLNVINTADIKCFCIKNNIHSIINCAAYTEVEQAENDIQLCNAINNIGTQNLSTVALELNIQLIHLSTDYVFDGTKQTPYTENDATNPLNIYGKTKCMGDRAMKQINPKNSIIIRTSWVYSTFGSNFVKTMLKLADIKEELPIVSDQIGNPTNAANLAKTILDILPNIKNKDVEIYHYSNEGDCSWYEFACEIFHQTQKKCKVTPIASSQYPYKAKRPLYTSLNKSKIKNTFGIEIPDWKTSLQDCLKKL